MKSRTNWNGWEASGDEYENEASKESTAFAIPLKNIILLFTIVGIEW